MDPVSFVDDHIRQMAHRAVETLLVENEVTIATPQGNLVVELVASPCPPKRCQSAPQWCVVMSSGVRQDEG